MIAIPAPLDGEERGPQQISTLTYGLVFGPALGMLVALLFVGTDAVATGLVAGAGLGVIVGILTDAGRRGVE